MADLKGRILEIIKQIQLSGVATVTEDGKPWVRYVMTLGSDDMRIRFATSTGTRKVRHIAQNPEVHIVCGVTDLAKAVSYLQIQGRARLATEQSERDAFWSDMLKPYFSGPDDPNYGLVIVTPYRIEYWGMGQHEAEVWEPD
jgi:general stress protein 26